MLARIDTLASLGTSVIAFSGGEPMLHPDLDLLVARIRTHGRIAGLITNG
jgi:MoaA/NifB/PqqE/SkfB family radical SAM enzyme